MLKYFISVTLFSTLTLTSTLFAEEKPDFTQVPGRVITYRPASSRTYLGSPGFVVLKDGTILAKCDEFGPATTEHNFAKTFVYKSLDQGKTWNECAVLHGIFWASIYLIKDEVYMLGTTKHHGDIVIVKSSNQGNTWTKPESKTTGLLTENGQYHTAPVPFVVKDARIYRSFEDASNGSKWGKRYSPMVISASLDSNLLLRENWRFTEYLKGDPKWQDGTFNGWLEGNIVQTPQGELVDVLRVDCPNQIEKAAIVKVDLDHHKMLFDPTKDFVNFPGGAKKFTIRYDIISKRYWSITNWVPSQNRLYKPASTRNTQALVSSSDLNSWVVHKILLQHPDQKNHGFQYIDWIFDGDDILFMSRTAYDDGIGGAHNNHDANFMTFHHCENFRHYQSQSLE